MTKKIIASVLAVLAIAGTSFAGTAVSSKESKQCVTQDTSYFKDKELQLDLFYSFNDGVRGGDRYFNDRSGGGLGLNYFFTRYFGVGAEGNWFKGGPSNAVLHDVSGSLIARLPLECCTLHVAPYLFVGGSEVWDGKETSLANVGAGMEVRLTPRFGVFADWRYGFTMGSSNNMDTTRAGVRFTF